MKLNQLIPTSTLALALALAGCGAKPSATASETKTEPTPAASTAKAAPDTSNHAEGDGHDHGTGSHDHGHDHASTTKFGLEVINASKGFRAGTPFELRVAVRNNQSGEIQKSFDTVHEKKLHLIVVSEGLTAFQHLHPTMDGDGFWSQRITLPHGGRFLVFADGGVGGEKFSSGTDLSAEGSPAPKPTFALSAEAKAEGITARVVEGAKLPLSDHAHVTIRLSNPAGWEPYLGEPGHLIMVRQGGKEFIHAHPKGAMKDGSVTFDAHFHEKGVFRAWAQFQRGGKVLTFPFTLEVGNAE
jgi:hypothetical protein